MRIKVCGLHDKENLKDVLELKPDFIGLNFYPASKRFCKFNALPDLEYGNTQLVGIFVNSNLLEIEDKVKRFNLSFIQLHGDEQLSDLLAIKDKLPNCKIIKVFGIEDFRDLEGLESWQALADYFLFDKKAISFGGTGIKFNWDILNNRVLSKEFFLAGGIGPEDARALKTLSKVLKDLFAVDINSRFEDSSGLKNISILKAFFEELRS